MTFLGIQLFNKSIQIQTNYSSNQPTLAFGSCIARAMLAIATCAPAYQKLCLIVLPCNWSSLSEECDGLKILFSGLNYPDRLINSTISHFYCSKLKASEQPVPELTMNKILFALFCHLKHGRSQDFSKGG